MVEQTADGVVEQIGPGYPESVDWTAAVWRRYGGACANCPSTTRLRVQPVVPFESGGRRVETNGVLLCWACSIRSGIAVVPGNPARSARVSVNFWVSDRLRNGLRNGVRSHGGFTSVGSMVRSLMSAYVADPTRFQDLDRFQDNGRSCKTNVWVDADLYDLFKRNVENQRITITDAIKALILMYEADTKESPCR